MKEFIKLPKAKMYDTNKINIDRFQARCAIGSKIDSKVSYGNITILFEGSPNARLFINKHILRSALLNSKSLLADVLKIQIEDLLEDDTPLTNQDIPEKIEKTPAPKVKKIIEPIFKEDKKGGKV